MGTKDTITKDYMADNRIFADVFNHLLYKGKNIIDPGSLQPLDTTALTVPYGAEKSEVPIQKFRDEFKSLTAMKDKSRIYLLLGIENQSEQHFAMPVKIELKAARVINSITGLNLQFKEKERMVDMCQAVQEMCDDARAEGRSQVLRETAQRMLQDPRFSVEDICKFLGLSLEDVLKLQKN